MRNFCIVEIIMRNAPRPGVIVNMTNEEFQARKLIGKNIHIAVHRHKNAHKYGPVEVIVEGDFAKILEFYYNCKFERFDKSGDDEELKKKNVFVTASGSPMDSTSVNRIFGEFAKSEGISKKVTSNLVRKYALVLN